jgi:thymidylate synthase (FAD)
LKLIEPKVFIIGESAAIPEGIEAMLDHLGVPDWTTDAHSDTELLSEMAGKLCYMSFDTSLNDNLTRTGTRNNEKYLQEGIIATKHGSVLEHTVVNLVLLDVSRVLTHELVRHGDGTAFSQESGRYVRRELGMYIPDIIKENPELLAGFIQAAENIEAQYTKLVVLSGVNDTTDFDWKKKMTSALRRVLPEGRANAIFFSANHRAMRHIIQMRTDRHAEEEVRKAFVPVFYAMLERYPAIYSDGNATVVNGILEIKFNTEKV